MKKILTLICLTILLTACSQNKNNLTVTETEKLLKINDSMKIDELFIENYIEKTYRSGYCDIEIIYSDNDEKPTVVGLTINTDVEDEAYQKLLGEMKNNYDRSKNDCYNKFTEVIRSKEALGTNAQELIDEMNKHDQLVDKEVGPYTFNYLFPISWSLYDTKIYNQSEYIFNS